MKNPAFATLSLFAAILPFLADGTSEAAEIPPRERILFTRDWRFFKGDPGEAGDALNYGKLKPWLLPTANDFITTPTAVRPEGEAPGEKIDFTRPSFNDSSWRSLNLPHDWGIEGDFDQKLPGETAKLPWFGIAWYRKTFDLPTADQGRRIWLEIDGAMSYSAVWCNGKLVGGWPYGYASYRLDLTPYLTPGSRNTLAIRLDNIEESSRWYPGAGIYRNVWLVKTSPVHVEPSGTFVTTPEISKESASISIKTKLANRSAAVAEVKVATQIYKLSSDGKLEGPALATSDKIALSIPAGGTMPGEIKLKLAKPKLWDIASPERYTAVTLVQQDGKLVDRYESPFGIRTIQFTADDGFHLNGRRVQMHGVCLHHDLGSLGAAFNVRAAERQLEMMKEMGCNAIRITHNPQAPEFLDLCDRMGFLVLDEFVDTWTQAKKPNGYAKLFKDWSEADWRSLIRRDRNHPSVVLWSSGNEIAEQGMEKLFPISQRLTDIAHEEDPTRLATAGCDRPKSGTNGFQKTVDVFGFNYKPMLYAKFRETNPDQPLYGSETSSAVSSRGEYLFPVGDDKAGGKIGFQMSSYDLYAPPWACPPDVEFKGQDENPFVFGEFVWTGFDYLGEPTPFNEDLTVLTNFHTPEAKAKAEEELKALGKIDPPSRSSYFGIIDLAGFKKDRFYIYQARWRPELPMAHILPHWNWQDRMGEVTPVHVYTSGDEAELFLNGQSLGRKKKAKLEYRLRWDEVKYAPGELKVVSYKNGKPWATSTVKTTGAAARLVLTADRAEISADGLDLSFLTASVTDQEGQMVPRSSQALKFEISGPGEIVSTDNGDPTDHTSFQSKERRAFNGLALAIVRGKPGADGTVTVKVTSEGLAPAEIKLNSTKP
ncbi:MAG: beta-galactosidase GalB [Verrucomicrobiota bacterium]